MAPAPAPALLPNSPPPVVLLAPPATLNFEGFGDCVPVGLPVGVEEALNRVAAGLLLVKSPPPPPAAGVVDVGVPPPKEKPAAEDVGGVDVAAFPKRVLPVPGFAGILPNRLPPAGAPPAAAPKLKLEVLLSFLSPPLAVPPNMFPPLVPPDPNPDMTVRCVYVVRNRVVKSEGWKR